MGQSWGKVSYKTNTYQYHFGCLTSPWWTYVLLSAPHSCRRAASLTMSGAMLTCEQLTAEFTSSCGTSVGIMFSDYMLNFGSPILGLGYAGVYSSSPTGLIMCWMQNIRIVRTSRRVAVLALTVPQRLKHSLCLDTIDHNRARQVASRNFAEEQRNRFSAVWADFRV